MGLNETGFADSRKTILTIHSRPKLHQKVFPGDTLILKMELTSHIRRGICEMKGTVYVGNKVCCEADLVAQIVKH